MKSNVIQLFPGRGDMARLERAGCIYTHLRALEAQAFTAGLPEVGLLIGVAALAASDAGEGGDGLEAAR